MRFAAQLASLAMAVSLALVACERSAHEESADTDAPAATGAFIHNGDGTLTDASTGLVWEQKCDCSDTPHHFETTYLWSGDGEQQTIWDWLEALNKAGFAGHSDWRIPNVKELVSLVDYERADPAVSPLLGACEEECSEPAGPGCGCTASGPYWSSTTFADFPAHALVVGFAVGGVDDQLKTLRGLVRAVRGPLPRVAGHDAARDVTPSAP